MENKNIKAAVCIISDANGRQLYLKRIKQIKNPALDGWCLPGGKINEGESVINCVIREVFEETGIELLNPVQCSTFISVDGNEVAVFKANVYNNAVILNKSEHTDFLWLPIPPDDILLAGNTIKALVYPGTFRRRIMGLTPVDSVTSINVGDDECVCIYHKPAEYNNPETYEVFYEKGTSVVLYKIENCVVYNIPNHD